MLKSHRVIREIGKRVRTASTSAIERVFSLHENIRGKEEILTAQIASEITLHLAEEIKNALDGEDIGGVKFRVHVFRKKEESHVGADLAGVLALNLDGRVTSKMYLAQAKVGRAGINVFGNDIVYVRDARLLGQVDNMLSITPSSYVFLYSDLGVEVLSAQAVKMLGKSNFSTDDLYTHPFGWFYEEFFKCFIGDSRFDFHVLPEELALLAEKVSANKVLMIEGTTES